MIGSALVGIREMAEMDVDPATPDATLPSMIGSALVGIREIAEMDEDPATPDATLPVPPTNPKPTRESSRSTSRVAFLTEEEIESLELEGNFIDPGEPDLRPSNSAIILSKMLQLRAISNDGLHRCIGDGDATVEAQVL
mgnify:CR=1 FL=1